MDNGKKLEQILMMEFIKKGFEIKCWRSKQKQEMDFVLFENNKPIKAIEAKSSGKKTDSFRAFVKNYPQIKASIANWENAVEVI